MGPKTRFFFLILFMIVTGGVALSVLHLVRNATPKVFTLPDGSFVEVHAALTGTNEFTSDSPFVRVIRRYAPSFITRRLPDRTIGRAGDTNELSIYMTRKNAAGGRLGPFWGRVDAVDEHGFVYLAESGGSFGVGDYMGFSARAFPRRGEMVLFKVYDPQGVFVTQFTVPNPVTGPFPNWTPEQMPLTKTNGPVELTLNSGKVVTNKGGYTYCNWSAALRSDDPLWQRFGEQRYSWLTDATGNSAGFLSPREPAWKVHFECFRKATTPFPADEVWKIENIAIPEDGTVNVLSLSNLVQGTKIWIPFIAGTGTVTITNGTNFSAAPFKKGYANQQYSWSSGSSGQDTWVERGSDCPFLMLQTSQPIGPLEVIFRLRGADGNIIPAERNISGSTTIHKGGEQVREEQKRFKLAAGQKVSLEVIVNRGYGFEFTVDPKAVAGTDKFLQPPIGTNLQGHVEVPH